MTKSERHSYSTVPKFTFLLPAYKIDFFAEALHSIQNQTHKEFKVIVCDDCSPADLHTIFEKMVGNDTRFEYHRNKDNVGGTSLVALWNKLVDNCESEFFIMASDDDVYSPNFLEEIDKLVLKHPSQNLYRARAKFIDEQGNTLKEDPILEENCSTLNFLYMMYNSHFIHCIGNYVFRTSLLKMDGGFLDLPLAWYTDDAAIASTSMKGVGNTRDILFGFRVSTLNISNVNKNDMQTKKRKVAASIAFQEWMDTFLSGLSYEHNKLNNHLFEAIKHGYLTRVGNMVSFYSVGMGFPQLIKVYRWKQKIGAFDGIRERVFYWWNIFTEFKSYFQ